MNQEIKFLCQFPDDELIIMTAQEIKEAIETSNGFDGFDGFDEISRFKILGKIVPQTLVKDKPDFEFESTAENYGAFQKINSPDLTFQITAYKLSGYKERFEAGQKYKVTIQKI